MAVAIKIPRPLRNVFNDEAADAFIDVLNQFDAAQRNGLEKTLEIHFNAFREYLEKRFAEADAKFVKLLAEVDSKFEKRFAEVDAKFEKRMAEVDANSAKRLAEMDAKFEKRFAENDVKMSQMQTALIRWMFTFFIGTIVTLATLFFSFIQVFVK